MANWIAEVCGIAFQLGEIGVTIDDEDLILVLTMGLPKSYDTFVISLDSTDPATLTLNFVITHLLNEQSRQSVGDPSCMSPALRDPGLAAVTLSSEKPGSRTGFRQNSSNNLAHIMCYKCSLKGHFQANCPTNQSLLKSQPSEGTANGAFDLDELDDGTDGSW
jgi:hypothetical protein